MWNGENPQNPYNPAGGTRHGQEGLLECLSIRRDSEEILVLHAVVGFTKCLAKPTNKTYDTDFVHLFSFKNNKIVKFQEYFDTFAAGEAFRK